VSVAGPERPIRVLLADDQDLVRAGFRMILAAQGDVDVVGEARDGEEAVGLARRERPDVVLMDVQMPRLDGLAATRRIVADATARVVMVTTFDRDDYLFESLRAGASGFLLKNSSPEELVAAVRTVARGNALLAPEVTRRVLEAASGRFRPPSTPQHSERLGDLTDRERDVLRLVGRGLSNTEIARELHVGEATVKTHVSHVLLKLDLRDRVQAVVFAYEAGLVQPRDVDPA
jgi:DNA-binding NarL/FixJ family response regulator